MPYVSQHLLTRGALTAMLSLAAAGAQAQATLTPPARWEFLMSSGTLIPTGVQRSTVARGGHSTAQLTFRLTPIVAASATLGWARSRDRAAGNDARLDVFMYDVGAELRAPRIAGDSTARAAFTLTPFVGLGAGARTYNSHAPGTTAANHATGYLSAGGEIGRARLRLRIDVRDYLSGPTPFRGRDARNDVVVTAGLRLVRK